MWSIGARIAPLQRSSRSMSSSCSTCFSWTGFEPLVVILQGLFAGSALRGISACCALLHFRSAIRGDIELELPDLALAADYRPWSVSSRCEAASPSTTQKHGVAHWARKGKDDLAALAPRHRATCSTKSRAHGPFQNQ